MRRSALATLAALAAVGAAPATASASPAAVIRDCQDGRIDGEYSQKEFSDALRSIPTDVDEYTDCRDVISRARLGAAGGGTSGGGTPTAGGGTPGTPGGAAPGSTAGRSAEELIKDASPAEQRAVQDAIAAAGEAPVQVGNRVVSPDTAGLSPAGAANVLPTPLIVALVLLGLALAAGAAQTLRSRVLARRSPSA